MEPRRLGPAVAEEVRVLLARRRISAVQLAKLMGVSQPYLSRRLNGAVALDLDDLEKIADVLGVAIADLLPRSAEAGGSLKRGYESATRSVDALKARPVSGGPFSGGRRDSTRPVSSVPATRRRPQVVSTPRRPKTA